MTKINETPAAVGTTLDQLLQQVRDLEAAGVVLPGKMKDGSPSIAAKISWVVGQLGLSNNVTTPEGMAALEETVRATVYRSVEDELCDLRAARLTEAEQSELRSYILGFEKNPFAQHEIQMIGSVRAVLSDETLQKIGFVLDGPPSPLVVASRAVKGG